MSVTIQQNVGPVRVAAEVVLQVMWSYLFTAYLEMFDTNRGQETEHIQETRASIVAVLEQTSRVEKLHAQHAL